MQEQSINHSSSSKPSKGFAIAALIVGILAFLLSWFPFLGGLLALTAIVLGIAGITKNQGGMAIAGLVLGVLAILINAFSIIGAVAYFGVLEPSNFLPEQCTMAGEDWACSDFIYEGSEVRLTIVNLASEQQSDVVFTATGPCVDDFRVEVGSVSVRDDFRVSVPSCDGESFARFDFSVTSSQSPIRYGQLVAQNVG